MRLAWAAGLVAVGVAGCSSDALAPEPEICDSVEPSGQLYQYVVDSLDLPATVTEAQLLGLDLDGDPQGRADNMLGWIVAVLTSGGEYDLDAETKLLIDAGELLHLVQIQTASWGNASGVGALILHGQDLDGEPADNFTGAEPFGIDEARGRGLSTGRVEDGVLTAECGTAPIAVTFPGLEQPFVLHLVGVRMEIEGTESGLSGRIGGALTQEEVDVHLVPVLAEGLSRIIDRDCSELGCEPGSFGETLLELFDDCSEESTSCDGRVSAEELRNNDFAGAALSPDVDLFDQNGDFNPRADEIKDSLSVGVGFTAVGASFSVQ